MPEGERAFIQARGPRSILPLRVSVDVQAALLLAAAEVGMSKTGYATWLLEFWAQEWLESKEGAGA